MVPGLTLIQSVSVAPGTLKSSIEKFVTFTQFRRLTKISAFFSFSTVETTSFPGCFEVEIEMGIIQR